MKRLGLKLFRIALVAILFHADYALPDAHAAATQGKVSLQSKTISATTSQPDSSLSTPVAAQRVQPEAVVVNYQNGELTIESINAPLSDILRAVCQRTGALIRVPPQASDRVTIKIGPGPVINVLGSLLYESDFNYMIEELGSDQGAPVRVTLSIKGTSVHALRLSGTQDQIVAMTWASQPEAMAARHKGMGERKELVREIVSMRLSLLEDRLRDKWRQ